MNDKSMEYKGKVWLVGAGPGDAGLLTVKGKQMLESADVVVYDRLIGQGILAYIPRTAETVDVGKQAGNHKVSQSEINQILAREAEKGKRVVRLKGGDPFLFGRGGEELELLAEKRIPFEIVPGITSAVSVPAYQGIPVTHRDFSSSFHVITGHQKADEPSAVNYEALVNIGGTLVFLMGLSALGDICRNLVKAGMPLDMPAAVLQSGTLAKQKCVTGTLENLDAEVRKAGITSPAIILVGKVCALHEKFSWVEKLPLGGRKILLTRARDKSSVTAEKFRALGAEVLEIPAIRTQPLPEQEQEQAADLEFYLERAHWLVFTSPAGVRIFFQNLINKKVDLRRLSSLKIAVVGPGTQKELEEKGIFADLVSRQYDGASLGSQLAERLKDQDIVMIFRAEHGNPQLVKNLKMSSQAEIVDIPAYRTIFENCNVPGIIEEYKKGNIDYTIFTSASTVRGFRAAFPELNCKTVTAVCIGKQTAAEAAGEGMQVYIAEKPSVDELVKSVVRLQMEDRTNNKR